MSVSNQILTRGAIAVAIAGSILLSGCNHGVSGVAIMPGSGSGAQSDVVQGPGFTSGAAGRASAVALDLIRFSGPDIFGYRPADLQSAYKLPSSTHGAGQTIAVALPFDDPVAGFDLDQYRSAFGLAPCTKGNGCFKKVNQRGVAGHYPRGDAFWAEGTSVFLDMASAICPRCHLLVVEADGSTVADLAASVDKAAQLGANVIVAPFEAADYTTNSHYNKPGKIIVAPAGDFGYEGSNVPFPAGSQYVVAVGGTHLARSTNSRGWHETAWSSGGSGCSPQPKPTWQADGDCSNRTVVDVAADADPNTGVAVFDTYQEPGWGIGHTTVVAASIIAGVYGLAANEGNLHYARGLYRFRGHLFDVQQGSNGLCGNGYLCTSKVGYDGPTGNGSPNGIGAF